MTAETAAEPEPTCAGAEKSGEEGEADAEGHQDQCAKGPDGEWCLGLASTKSDNVVTSFLSPPAARSSTYRERRRANSKSGASWALPLVAATPAVTIRQRGLEGELFRTTVLTVLLVLCVDNKDVPRSRAAAVSPKQADQYEGDACHHGRDGQSLQGNSRRCAADLVFGKPPHLPSFPLFAGNDTDQQAV